MKKEGTGKGTLIDSAPESPCSKVRGDIGREEKGQP